MNKMSSQDFNWRLLSAVHEGSCRKVEKIFRSVSGSSINSITDNNGLSLLCVAAYKGHSHVVDYLLTCGAYVNFATLKDGYTALHFAVNINCTEIVKLLLNRGANVNAKCKNGATPLHIATERGYFKMASLLLKQGADPNSAYNCAFSDIRQSEHRAGCTPLYFAAKYGYIRIVQLLMNNGAAVNTLGKDKEGIPFEANALHIACETGKIIVVKVLINSGADVNFKDSKSNTALHFAAKYPCSDIIQILLKSSANIEAKDGSGRTALHIAGEAGLVDNVEALLMCGADIESTDVSGRTPLHMASQHSNIEAAKTLLKYGSDINSISLDNYTPFHLAMNSITNSYKIYKESLKCISLWFSNHFKQINIIYLMNRHIVKMKVAKLYVCEFNLKLVNDAWRNIVFERECEKEIERLKGEKINYQETLYDIVTKRTYELSEYVESEDVYKFLKSSDYEESFPIYASFIKTRFKLVMERKELVKQCYIYFYSTHKMPSECTDKILRYLTNRDIKFLVVAFKNGNIVIRSIKELHASLNG